MTSITAANAKRLANTLDRYNDDKRVIEILAHYLNYEPEQLVKDIEALQELTNEKE